MNFINIREYINPAVLTGIIVLLLIFQIIQHKNKNSGKNSKNEFLTEIFKTESGGFGYQIKLNNQVIINQETIPAIALNAPFKTEKDARKTSELVVQKLKNKNIPSVTLQELDSLGIKY